METGVRRPETGSGIWHPALAWLTLFLLFGSLAFAQEKYAGSSLELGVGARPLALGGAAAAYYGTIDGFISNPASLAFLQNRQISFMHAPTFGGIKNPMADYNYIGIALPLVGGGVISANWTRFSVDDIPLYPELNGDTYSDRFKNPSMRPDGTVLGYFNDQEDVYYFSFAKGFNATIPLGWLFMDLPVQFPFGVNLKIIKQSLHNATASGVGLDMGAALRFSMGELLQDRRFGDFTLGFSMLDVARTAVVWSTNHENRIETSYLFGLSYEHKLWFNNAQLNFFWTNYKKYRTDHLFGLELSLANLAIRIGKNYSGITTGAGIRVWRFNVDYAFITADFDTAHRLSVLLSF